MSKERYLRLRNYISIQFVIIVIANIIYYAFGGSYQANLGITLTSYGAVVTLFVIVFLFKYRNKFNG